METQQKYMIGFLSLLLIALMVIFFITIGKDKQETETPEPMPSSKKAPEETQEMQKVILFFLSEEDGLLHPEEREIPVHPSFVHQAKQTIRELVRGSDEGYITPFPLGTDLRELYVTEKGIAYVDISRELREMHPSGSSAEVSTIFSLVNSLTHNFDQIAKVHVLIDGGGKQTLKGHVDLSRAFSPKEDLVVR